MYAIRSYYVISLWQDRFKQDIYEAIGMSECSYYISHSIYNPIRPGSAGFVQPGHTVRLLDPETLEEVGVEEEGMICIGEDDPGLFLEYWQLDDETAKAKHDVITSYSIHYTKLYDEDKKIIHYL